MKKSIWITSLVVLVVVIIVLTLSLVKINPLASLGEYSRAAVIAAGESERGEVSVKETLEEQLPGVSFSIMHAMLEGKFDYAPHLKTTKKDGETVNVTMTAAEIESIDAVGSEFLVRFYYDETKTVNVDGTEISFDRLIVRFVQGAGEVSTVECIAYLDKNVGNQSMLTEYDETGLIGSMYYSVNVFNIKLYTTKLYLALQEVL